MLVTATLCLLSAGAVMVYSASSPDTLLPGQGSATGYLVKFVAYGAVGLVLMRFTARVGLDGIRRATPGLLAVAFCLLVAVKVPGIGRSVNGARRWIGAGPLVFEPSELMKLALVLYAAHILSSGRMTDRRLRAMVRPLLLVGAAACGLVAMQPDLGTALVLAFTLICVLVAAGVPTRTLGRLLIGGVIVVGLFAVLAPYRRARLTAFLDPWAHPGTSGFQSVQGQIAIGSGGLFGAGPGQSVEKVFYLPEAHTDFILAVIGEELGFVGVLIVILLFYWIVRRAFEIGRQALALDRTFAGLMAKGIGLWFGAQTFINMGVNLGLLPTKGLTLPLVSYGGSGILLNCVALAVLMRVDYENRVLMRGGKV
jgi:cell division protein FtsW